MAKAPAKSIDGNVHNLSTIVSLYSEINGLKTELNIKKTQLKEETDILSHDSRDLFDSDLGVLGSEEVPKIYGNHEYPFEDKLITVNYKMKAGGLSFTQVGGRPANEVLPELIDAKEYKKLFKETETIKESSDKLKEVQGYRPDLVGYRLTRELPDKVLEELRAKHPECFTVFIKDEEAYKREITDAVIETEVQTGPSFIEKVSNLSDDSKFKLKDFIRKVLGSKAVSAVKVGNVASE